MKVKGTHDLTFQKEVLLIHSLKKTHAKRKKKKKDYIKHSGFGTSVFYVYIRI